VEDEVLKGYTEERRRRRTQVLLPIRLDDSVMRAQEAWALKLRDQLNIGDFRHWRAPGAYETEFKELLKALKRDQDKN
jgi:hypothetical protein